MKGSRPFCVSMCQGFGLASKSLTDPCDRPRTDSPNSLWLMEYWLRASLTLLTMSSVFKLLKRSNCCCVIGGRTAFIDLCTGGWWGGFDGWDMRLFVIDAILCSGLAAAELLKSSFGVIAGGSIAFPNGLEADDPVDCCPGSSFGLTNENALPACLIASSASIDLSLSLSVIPFILAFLSLGKERSWTAPEPFICWFWACCIACCCNARRFGKGGMVGKLWRLGMLPVGWILASSLWYASRAMRMSSGGLSMCGGMPPLKKGGNMLFVSFRYAVLVKIFSNYKVFNLLKYVLREFNEDVPRETVTTNVFNSPGHDFGKLLLVYARHLLLRNVVVLIFLESSVLTPVLKREQNSN